MTRSIARREFLSGAACAALGIAGAAAHAAQRNRTPTIFGVPVPDALMQQLPAQPMDAIRIVEVLRALEREADLKRLPASILSRPEMLPTMLNEDRLYELVMPRLVALVDRAERRDIPFADRAGGLLAQIHSTQHEPAAGWATIPLSANGKEGRTGAFALQADPAGAIPPRIDLPPGTVPSILPAPLPTMPPVDVAGEPEKPTTPELPQQVPPSPEADRDEPMRRSTRFVDLKDEYRRLFADAAIRAEHRDTADWHLAQMRTARARYDAVGQRVGVPWYFIGAIHGLEASFNFRAHLHNGDFPLSQRTRQVPAGRPLRWLPPSDWESSALDALRLLGFAGQEDWSLERTLYRLEAYNGFGYRTRGVPTPYLWSFSNHYDRGKFVADGRWSATARSQQCGAAVMLKMLAAAGDANLG